MSKAAISVPDRLASLGAIYRDRNKVYGDNYKFFGRTMKGIFPRGLTLETEDDFNRFGVFVQIVAKATRYGQAFASGHKDSLDDTSVYAQMLAELDDEMSDRKKPTPKRRKK